MKKNKSDMNVNDSFLKNQNLSQFNLNEEISQSRVEDLNIIVDENGEEIEDITLASGGYFSSVKPQIGGYNT